ncbi:MAG: hypothetical protein Q8Q48_03630 [Candidatus Staskawiczbacteria bacterium]|nr:hypothetical protein [Candidatus Staskawiczbacteria bacterium]
MDEDLIKKADIQKISSEGEKIYEGIKSKYEPQDNGKFLAIEVFSKDVYLANSTVEAVEMAKKKHPDKVFYVVKIGFDSVETLANYFVKQAW